MRNTTRGVVIVPILVGLAVAAVVWVASYRGGGPKLVDSNAPHSNLAAAPITPLPPVAASSPNENSAAPSLAAKTADMANH